MINIKKMTLGNFIKMARLDSLDELQKSRIGFKIGTGENPEDSLGEDISPTYKEVQLAKLGYWDLLIVPETINFDIAPLLMDKQEIVYIEITRIKD